MSLLLYMGVETCSNDVDQYALCWSTNDHGKPRGTLLPNAVYRHGCLYTSGCRLALVILLFYALFFQAAVAQNTSEWYPGWGRTLINNSASTNSSTYYYYPLQQANAVQTLFNLWVEPHYIEWPPISSNNVFPCFTETWLGIVCTSVKFQDPYNNYSINHESFIFNIAILDLIVEQRNSRSLARCHRESVEFDHPVSFLSYLQKTSPEKIPSVLWKAPYREEFFLSNKKLS